MSESAPSKQRSVSFWRCVALSSTLRLLIECSSSVPLGFFSSFFCWLPLCCMLFSYTHTQACNSVAPLLTSVAPQIWSKNIKVRSIDLTALKKHGKVYEDGEWSAASCLLPDAAVIHQCYWSSLWSTSTDQFGCLVWSHSETHLLYVAEKKRAKTASFFQVCPSRDLIFSAACTDAGSSVGRVCSWGARLLRLSNTGGACTSVSLVVSSLS